MSSYSLAAEVVPVCDVQQVCVELARSTFVSMAKVNFYDPPEVF